jgi:type IV pilus assembly protein PilO
MNLKIKIENNPYLVIGGIVFFILLMDYFILLHPQLRMMGAVNKQTGTFSRNLKTARRDIASLEQFRKRLDTLQEKIALAGERIAREEEMPVVLENISQTAKQSNLKITQLKPSREEEKVVAITPTGVIYELPVMVEARCGYHQLGNFINQLENGKTLVSVSGLQILPSLGDSTHHNVKLVLSTYILKRK